MSTHGKSLLIWAPSRRNCEQGFLIRLYIPREGRKRKSSVDDSGKQGNAKPDAPKRGRKGGEKGDLGQSLADLLESLHLGVKEKEENAGF